MTLVCKPCGRGNWNLIFAEFKDIAADFFKVKPGDRLTVADMKLRVIEVRP